MIVYCNSFSFGPHDHVTRKLSRIIAKWIEKKLDHSFDGELENFSNNLGLLRYEKFTSKDNTVYEFFELKHQDKFLDQRFWITEVSITSSSKGIYFSCLLRVEDLSVIDNKKILITRPTFIRAIREEIPEQYQNNVIGYNFTYATSQMVPRIISEIESKERKHSVILLSTLFQGGSTIFNEQALIGYVYGLANIYIVDRNVSLHASREYSNGDLLACWNGAAKIHYPLLKSSKYYDLIKPFEISEIQENNFESFFLNKLSRWHNSIHYVKHLTYERLISIKSSDQLNAFVEDSKKVSLGLSQQQELIEKLYAFIEAKDNDLKDKELELDIISKDFVLMESKYQRLEEENKILKRDLHILKTNEIAQGNVSENTNLLKDASSLDDVYILCSEHYSSRIHFTNKAVRSLEGSPYREIRKVTEAFFSLINIFHERFAQNLPIDSSTIEKLSNLGIEYAANISESVESFPGYQGLYKGKRIDMNKHLKLGNSRDPQHCFRIHFDWDDEDKRIVIHHAGRHLDTTKT